MGLKSVIERDDIRTVFRLYEGVEFSKRVFHLSFVEEFVFVHLFQSHEPGVFFGEIDRRKASRIYFVSDFK